MEALFRRFGPSWWARLVGLGIVNGIVFAVVPTLFDQGAAVAAISMVVGVLGVDYIFVSARTYHLRWLVPGLIFLGLLLIWPIIFTVFVALSNWSTGNFISKDQAIRDITESTRYLVQTEDSPIADLFLYRDPDAADPLDPLAGLTMLVRDPAGALFYGAPRLRSDPAPDESPLLELDELDTVDEDGDGIPERIERASLLLLRDIGSVNQVLDQLVLDIEGRGRATVQRFTTAIIAEQRFAYDADRDVLVDRVNDGTCAATDGTFFCDGVRIDPGFRAPIGLDNFQNIVTDARFRTPFLRVLSWNIVYATAVVVIQLAIGIGLALTFRHERMRLKGWLRALLLVPYAAPAFITVLVWRGLLNETFGPVNRLIDPLVTLVRDSPIPWLTDGFWAKVAVILVSVWQGFAYFFLISTGAMASIPTEIEDAARVDGASSPQVFRRVTFPLLMVGMAPLIIASFGYNFNAFVNIFLLTEGGPQISGYAVPVGETDILISYTFNLAIASGRGGQLSLAAANTFFIFFIVATIAAISFRYTKRLETIYGSL